MANNWDEIGTNFQTLMEQLPENGVSFEDADKLAIKFLMGAAKINFHLKNVKCEIIGARTQRNIAEAQAFQASDSKTVDAKKKDVAQDITYISRQEMYKELEAVESYFSNMYKLFELAHIYYKHIAREGNSSRI